MPLLFSQCVSMFVLERTSMKHRVTFSADLAKILNGKCNADRWTMFIGHLFIRVRLTHIRPLSTVDGSQVFVIFTVNINQTLGSVPGAEMFHRDSLSSWYVYLARLSASMCVRSALYRIRNVMRIYSYIQKANAFFSINNSFQFC